MKQSSDLIDRRRGEMPEPRAEHAYGRLAGACVTDMLTRRAAARPQDIAVIAPDGQLTYWQLERAAHGLARHLRDLGIGPDDCVGVYTEPSLDQMIAIWGILFAGAAYLPLSPEYPQDRLRYMIEDSASPVLVTQPGLASLLADLVPRDRRILTLAETGLRDPRPPGDRAALPPPRPSSLAYVIYTSGSTGQPKGVMIEHGSIAAQMRWMHDVGRVEQGATVLQKTPMSFDAAQWEILAPAVGARVVLGAPGIHRDVEALIGAITAHRVTILQGVPTLLQALVDSGELAGCGTLTRVFSGGEALTRELARDVMKALPGALLINLYGPTECTINATSMLADPDDGDADSATIPIGVPVDNTSCFILDENMAPVGIGETGQLYIGGVQLARGYLNRPDQTREKFVASPFVPTERLYSTGDLASWNPDGTIQFIGRADNQVKLNGHRVELDEVAVSIAAHPWVRRAAALVTPGAHEGRQALVACVELNPREAALMDQGLDEAHHRSKQSRFQVSAQLSGAGLRDQGDLRGRHRVGLPGATETGAQRHTAFARKTYRFFDGEQVTAADLISLLSPRDIPRLSRDPDEVQLAELGEILRWFGQFHSESRLLPKYTYASPGALYATQLYLETSGRDGVDPGVYYYHPGEHALYRIGESTLREPGLLIHLAGKRRAIEPVYQRNIAEVLEMEAGHMLGVFEEVLPRHGLTIAPLPFSPAVRDRLGITPQDHYLGTFALAASGPAAPEDPTETYVLAHPRGVDGLPAGLYRHVDGRFERLSDELVLRRHVIAINQRVYDRAGFGIAVVSRTGPSWLRYINLGRKLHQLQRNDLRIGLMSAGYSSDSGFPLPAAVRLDDIFASCGIRPAPLYYAVGGRVSAGQVASEGMYEDSVHTQGPAELIKEELARSLPRYMLPSTVIVMDRLPLTANGKVDVRALADRPELAQAAAAPRVAPVTEAERWLARQWGEMLKSADVSTQDEFFAAGGNSLIAVALVNRINKRYGTRLPLQTLFETPKLADLAARIGSPPDESSSRLVPLAGAGAASDLPPVFCWPGLGGYPMNLRSLALAQDTGRPFYGIQACGLNDGESAHPTIAEMAAADIEEIRRVQPAGPYTLYGYSFGARVAFEAAWQLEQAGERVEQLLLLCPGNPRVGPPGPPIDQGAAGPGRRTAAYDNPAYLTILFSVFAGSARGPEVDLCLRTVRDEEGFVSFVRARYPALGEHLIRRIIRLVARTYEFEYTFHELAGRRLRAPVGIIKATGDDYSWMEESAAHTTDGRPAPTVIQLAGDHYRVLREPGVNELADAIRSLRSAPDRALAEERAAS